MGILNSFDGFCSPEDSQSVAYEEIRQESVKGTYAFHLHRVFLKWIAFRGIPNNRNPSFFWVKPWTPSIIKTTYLYWESSTKNSRHLFHKQFLILSETTSTCAWEKRGTDELWVMYSGKENLTLSPCGTYQPKVLFFWKDLFYNLLNSM